MLKTPSIIFLILIISQIGIAQNTTGGIKGMVNTPSGLALYGASIKLIHEPTGTYYFTRSSISGRFYFANLMPGGPYAAEVQFIGFQKDEMKNIQIELGTDIYVPFILKENTSNLGNLTVYAKKRQSDSANKPGTTIYSKEKMEELPVISRNILEYLSVHPAIKTSYSNEGAISIAGQHNRYNAFYIDGAVSNDVFGLGPSGMNGGNAGISPLSIDALEQLQVAVSPYDASLGNFTGGTIQAITRSGNNYPTSSGYHFFSNSYMNGHQKKSANSTSNENGNASSYTTGIQLSGYFKKNQLFYSFNVEKQRLTYADPYDFETYSGNTKNALTISILANTLQTSYRYDPGKYLEGSEIVNAEKTVAKIDWYENKTSRISFSHRYQSAQKMLVPKSDAHTIRFSHTGYLIHAKTHSLSMEWNKFLGNNKGNRLLLTYNLVTDNRHGLGKDFPFVRINDGEGALLLGTDINSTANHLQQQQINLYDKFNFVAGKHFLNAGIEVEYVFIKNIFQPNSYGNYSFANITDFLRNDHPSNYQLGYPITANFVKEQRPFENKFPVLRNSFFVNDEIRPSQNTAIYFGIRTDQHWFLKSPETNSFVNDTVLPFYAKYREIGNTRSGNKPVIPFTISPRAGFVIHWPDQKISISGGLGIFSGRIPLAWPAGIYINNGLNQGNYQAEPGLLNRMRFRPNPSTPHTIYETGANANKLVLNLITEKIRLPKQFRYSFAIEKNSSKQWYIKWEAMFLKNLEEISYTNLNLLPATERLTGPDNRLVYSLQNKGRIPINADGTNPYEYAILLGNNQGLKGASFLLTTRISRQFKSGWQLEAAHSFGNSTSVLDGTSFVNTSQWRFNETVDGKNFPLMAVSDFSAGHRLTFFASSQWMDHRKKRIWSLSLFYSGQSGTPFSYVYEGSVARDDGINSNYDLLYVPTSSELRNMDFLNLFKNGKLITPEEQKVGLEKYILGDPYLQNRRGQYAERNGSRTPFTHSLNLQIKKDFSFQWGKQRFLIRGSLDLYNLGNFINQNWGWKYELPFDQIPLISYAGLSHLTSLPQYRFDPEQVNNSHWQKKTALQAAYSSHWSCRIGIRVTCK